MDTVRCSFFISVPSKIEYCWMNSFYIIYSQDAMGSVKNTVCIQVYSMIEKRSFHDALSSVGNTPMEVTYVYYGKEAEKRSDDSTFTQRAVLTDRSPYSREVRYIIPGELKGLCTAYKVVFPRSDLPSMPDSLPVECEGLCAA